MASKSVTLKSSKSSTYSFSTSTETIAINDADTCGGYGYATFTYKGYDFQSKKVRLGVKFSTRKLYADNSLYFCCKVINIYINNSIVASAYVSGNNYIMGSASRSFYPTHTFNDIYVDIPPGETTTISIRLQIRFCNNYGYSNVGSDGTLSDTTTDVIITYFPLVSLNQGEIKAVYLNSIKQNTITLNNNVYFD